MAAGPSPSSPPLPLPCTKHTHPSLPYTQAEAHKPHTTQPQTQGHTCAADPSSPMNLWSGKAARILLSTSSSHRLSVSVTRSVSPVGQHAGAQRGECRHTRPGLVGWAAPQRHVGALLPGKGLGLLPTHQTWCPRPLACSMRQRWRPPPPWLLPGQLRGRAGTGRRARQQRCRRWQPCAQGRLATTGCGKRSSACCCACVAAVCCRWRRTGGDGSRRGARLEGSMPPRACSFDPETMWYASGS